MPLGVFSAPAQFFIDTPGLLSPADIATLDGGSIADFYQLVSQPGAVPPDPTRTLDGVSAYPTTYDTENWDVSVQVDWQVGGTTVRSISAYRDAKLDFTQDSTGAGTPAVVFDPSGQSNEQFSQEFNFFGSAFDEKLDWLFGFFFLRDEANFHAQVWIPTAGDATLAGLVLANPAYDPTDPASFAFQLIPQEFFPYNFWQAQGAGREIDVLSQVLRPMPNRFASGPGPHPATLQRGDIPQQVYLGFEIDQTTTSVAAFSQFTYHVNDDFRITAGIRFTDDTKDATRSVHNNITGTFLQLGVPNVNPDGSPILCDDQKDKISWSEWTGTIGVDYDINDSTLVYARYSDGYKAGAFNPGECGEPYNPEYLDAFEIGLKSTFLDGQVLTNLAVYAYQYDDIQFTLYVPNQSFIRNAGEAETWGIELEYVLRPDFLAGLSIDGGISYQDSEYTDGRFRDPAGIVANGIDIKGNSLIRAPEWKLNIGAQYEFPVGPGTLMLRVEGVLHRRLLQRHLQRRGAVVVRRNTGFVLVG